jgi:hypothetical protein
MRWLATEGLSQIDVRCVLASMKTPLTMSTLEIAEPDDY